MAHYLNIWITKFSSNCLRVTIMYHEKVLRYEFNLAIMTSRPQKHFPPVIIIMGEMTRGGGSTVQYYAVMIYSLSSMSRGRLYTAQYYD